MGKKEKDTLNNRMDLTDDAGPGQDTPGNNNGGEMSVDNKDAEITSDNKEKATDQSPGTGGNKKSPDEVIAELQVEIGVLKDQLLRKQADYENFRKRLYREKDDSVKYANQMLLLDITSMIDNFERAMKSAEESKDFDAFHKGIVMIENQLVSLLEKKWGLKRFDSVGEVFDPDRHLAIAVEESPDYNVPTVIEDYQRGYLFHERVLRPAKVKVAQPVANNEDISNKNNQESDNDKE
jgi:molecular chaperone GrpE